MTLPPEVLFHRYFQELGPWERRKYHGKHDLRGLEPLEQLLIGIQDALNEGLNEEHRDPQHSDCRPFHFDYIDSTVQNARAFRYGSYFFIGITIPLVHALWSSCHLLSRSDLIASALGVRLKGEERDGLRTVSFRTTLSFLALHEWTHHAHGHLDVHGSEPTSLDELLHRDQPGGLEQQALEVDADGYAVFLVLNNLIAGSARLSAVTFLNFDAESESVQDEVLLSCFVVAVGACLYALPPATVDSAEIYARAHPPQAERMNRLMQQAMRWCQQVPPDLVAWMTPPRFQELMTSSAETILGDGGMSWAAQTAFLTSTAGREYNQMLDSVCQAYVRSLSADAKAPAMTRAGPE
jgi:hypothetical protein